MHCIFTISAINDIIIPNFRREFTNIILKKEVKSCNPFPSRFIEFVLWEKREVILVAPFVVVVFFFLSLYVNRNMCNGTWRGPLFVEGKF